MAWQRVGIALAIGFLMPIFLPALAQVSLVSFSVELESDTAEVTLTFSAPVNVSSDGPCFLNKLIFVDSNTPTRMLNPMFYGSCDDSTMSPVVVGRLDIRDFASELTIGIFGSLTASSVVTKPGSEGNFLPGISIVPITNPLQPAAFTDYQESPTLLGFDVDLSSNLLLLHFSDIMSLTGFRSTGFTLYAGSASTNFLILSSDSTPRTSATNVKTVCITLSASDVTLLMSRSICTNADRCYCSYTSLLGINYAAVPVIPSTSNVKVTNLIPRLSSTAAPRLYVTLILSYIDCSVTRLLVPDEVYFVRRGEYVNSVSCYATGEGMWPNLTFGEYNEMLVPQGLSRTQNSSSLWVTNGFSSEMLGLYTCATADYRIHHYVITAVPSFIGLPQGPQYSARLYDSLTIPFFFGSRPQVNLTDQTVEIVLSQLVGSGLTEPQYMKVSAYKGKVFYDVAPYSIGTNFRLTVISSAIQNPMTTLSISISDPEISTIPAVVGLLPSDKTFTLQCITGNPLLKQFLFWIPGLTVAPVRSSSTSITLQVSTRAPFYICGLLDPEDMTRVAVAVSVIVRQIPEPVSVYNNGNYVNNTAEFEVRNQFSPNISLQCIGNAASDAVDVVWISEKTGESLVELQPVMNSNQIQVTYSYNEANITVVNSVEPYQGTLRCQSRRSGRHATFYIVQTRTQGTTTVGCLRDVDATWGIMWEPTRKGFTGSQPCPQVNGTYTGFAYRQCDSNGDWASTVNVSRCNSDLFDSLSAGIDAFTDVFDSMSSEDQIATIEPLITSVQVTTAPRNISLFPQELSTSVNIIDDLINLLIRMFTLNQYKNLDVANAFDSLLDTSNAPGWRDLNRMDRTSGGLALLNSIQNVFRRYLYLVVEAGQTKYLQGSNLYMNVVKVSDGMYTTIVFPNNSDSRARDAQITIPTAVLMENQATGVVTSVIRNIAGYLPSPSSDNTSDIVTQAASNLISPVFYPDMIPTAANTSEIQSKYLTYRVLRGSNPRCVYWNTTSSSWDVAEIQTTSIQNVEIEEYKTFEVECSKTQRRSVQAVLVDMPKSTVVYEVTTAAYVGSGFILFFITMTMFLYFISCVFGKDLSYFTSPYFVHLSFCSSTIAAFVVFLSGISLGVGNEGICTLVSVLLHYFFTAAFVWLLCETFVLVAFKWVSTHCWSFIIFFFIGWGLPVIPVVISVGLLTNSYTSTTHCWFFFDGEISSRIFLAFFVPKLIIVAAIVVLLPMSLITACRLKSKTMQGETRLPFCLILLSWLGILVQLLLFCAVWVFLMFHVNNYLETSGWIFAGVAIALAIWVFTMSLLVVLLNQRIDHESFWAVFSGAQTLKRPKKTKEEKHDDDIPLEQDIFAPSEAQYVNDQETTAAEKTEDEQQEMTAVGKTEDEQQEKTYID